MPSVEGRERIRSPLEDESPNSPSHHETTTGSSASNCESHETASFLPKSDGATFKPIAAAAAAATTESASKNSERGTISRTCCLEYLSGYRCVFPARIPHLPEVDSFLPSYNRRKNPRHHVLCDFHHIGVQMILLGQTQYELKDLPDPSLQDLIDYCFEYKLGLDTKRRTPKFMEEIHFLANRQGPYVQAVSNHLHGLQGEDKKKAAQYLLYMYERHPSQQ